MLEEAVAESDVVTAPARVSEPGDLQKFIARAMAPYLLNKVTVKSRRARVMVAIVRYLMA
jgi:hypothetical protein